MCGKNYLGEALRRKGEYERSLDLLQQSLAGTTLHYTTLYYTILYHTILYMCVWGSRMFVPSLCWQMIVLN
jgi:hypothetical protein